MAGRGGEGADALLSRKEEGAGPAAQDSPRTARPLEAAVWPCQLVAAQHQALS